MDIIVRPCSIWLNASAVLYYTNEMRFLSFKLERGIRTAANWNRNESNAWVYVDIVC